MTGADIVRAARDLVGTPFRHQGRSPAGVDCVGLAVVIAEGLGIPVVDQSGYGRRPQSGLLEAAFEDQPALVRVADRQPGDLLLMRFDAYPQHLAIFAGWSDAYQGEGIVHAWLASRRVCEHRLDDDWRRRIVRTYRFMGAA